jgi:dipeptidyl aminopeptidase/acylaminoacyl peptidase
MVSSSEHRLSGAARRLAVTLVLAVSSGSPAIAGCSALMPSSTGIAAVARTISASDLIELRTIGFPDAAVSGPPVLALSPDGKSVAFLLSRADLASDSYCNGLVVAPLDGQSPPRLIDKGGEFMPLTTFVRGLSVNVGLPRQVTPAWSPDGQSIAYLRREQGVTQLFVARSGGQEGRQVTNAPADVEAVSWLPGGDRLLVALRPTTASAKAAIESEGRSGWLYDERIATNEGVRPRVREADVPLEKFVVGLGDGSMRRATAGEVALAAAGGTYRPGASAWTPFLRIEGSSLVSPERLWARDSAGREIRCGAEKCLGGISAVWADPGRNIVRFLRREGWNRESYAFYRWRPGEAAPVRTYATLDVVQYCVPAAAILLCTVENATSPRKVVAIDPSTGSRRIIFDPNPEFAGIGLGPVKRLRWRNNRGLEAWGDLVLPPGARTGEKLPMIVVQYHSRGFLRGGTGDEYPIFLLAARGFAVLSFERPPDVSQSMPNLKTEAELNAASEAGWADRKSLLSAILGGVKAALATGAVDAGRLGITGLSDGATSTRFALINSDVFAAAAISSCCIEPKTSMTYGGIAWADFNRSAGYPPATVDDPSFWEPVSIALNAVRMRTPLLMQLSDDEYLLSLEAFEALREHGAPVELHVFPDEHHVKWHPVHRLAIYERNLDWFDFWLRCSEDRLAAKSAQYRRWRAMRARLPQGRACAPSGFTARPLPRLPHRPAA